MRILQSIFKFFVAVFAIIMIVIGILLTPSPIPFGIIFIILGFLLLSAVAPDLVRWLRRRWGWLDRLFQRFEAVTPSWLMREFRVRDRH